MSGNFKQAMTEIIALITQYGLSVIGAVLILIAGLVIARISERGVLRAISKFKKIDVTLGRFVASLARYAVLIFTGLAVLNQFGIETTSIIALLGAAGLAIGLALQGTLSNLAAGVMLLIFRPFKVGNYIDAGGIAGTVEEISLFVTALNTADNVHVIVPNGELWGAAIRNYSHNPTRRLEIVVGIGYGDDIDRAMAVVGELIAADSRILAQPAPAVVVGDLADNSVNLIVRAWTASGASWAAKCDLLKAIKQRFDAEGLTFPYPQREVHLSPAAVDETSE